MAPVAAPVASDGVETRARAGGGGSGGDGC